MTRIIMIRHGETEWNQLGIYQGQLNSNLTENGRNQAIAIAQRLQNHKFDCLYSSDLGRAQETAQPVSKACNLPLQLEKGLRERNYGIFEGLEKNRVADVHSEAYISHKTNDPHYDIPNGESMFQFQKRVWICIETLAKKHEGKSIIIVTHGGTIAAIVYKILSMDLSTKRPFSTLNTSYNEIYQSGDRWLLKVLGDTSHLFNTALEDIV